MEIVIDRDSVSTEDAAADHRVCLEVPEKNWRRKLLGKLRRMHYFPRGESDGEVWVLTCRREEFCIFSCFSIRGRLCSAPVCIPMRIPEDGGFRFKYYPSPEEWKKRIIAEYGDDTLCRWHDGWDDEIAFCDKLTEKAARRRRRKRRDARREN